MNRELLKEVLKDERLFGLFLLHHPVAAFRDDLTQAGYTTAEGLRRLKDDDRVKVAGRVIIVHTPPTKSDQHDDLAQQRAGIALLRGAGLPAGSQGRFGGGPAGAGAEGVLREGEAGGWIVGRPIQSSQHHRFTRQWCHRLHKGEGYVVTLYVSAQGRLQSRIPGRIRAPRQW